MLFSYASKKIVIRSIRKEASNEWGKTMFYRVKQFMKAITAKVSPEEKQWVKRYLSETEYSLFIRLKIYEQRHCIDVACLLKEKTQEDPEMIRLGLLHDIGKIVYPLNPIEKSLMVVLDKLSNRKISQFKKMKMVKCYYGHPQLGYELLKQQGQYDEDFLEIIKQHHLEGHAPKLLLLQEADNLC